MSRLTVGSLEGLSENSNVISVPTGHTLNVADAGALQIGGSGVVSAGLVFIGRTTIGSAVSSVTLSNIFSSTYDHYRVLISGGFGSTGGQIRFKFPGAATADYFHQLFYGAWTTGNAQLQGHAGTNQYFNYMGTMDTTSLQACVDIQSPYLSERTYLHSYHARAPHLGGVTANVLNNSTSYTDLEVVTSTGTFSDGNIDVYGYAKA